MLKLKKARKFPERALQKARNIDCLCTYDVAKLSPEKIKQLAGYHNQLRLTTSDLTILSGDLFDEPKASGDSIEKMVKDNLESIILAILQNEYNVRNRNNRNYTSEIQRFTKPRNHIPAASFVKTEGDY